MRTPENQLLYGLAQVRALLSAAEDILCDATRCMPDHMKGLPLGCGINKAIDAVHIEIRRAVEAVRVSKIKTYQIEDPR
jgi:hypothetical protein